jgi:nitrile hydratase
MGGQTGFGPIPVADDGQAFHADWEARVYALTTAIGRRGIWTGDEFRDAIERIPPAEYLALSYFERWLRAAELLLAEKSVLTGPGAAPAEGAAPAPSGRAAPSERAAKAEGAAKAEDGRADG